MAPHPRVEKAVEAMKALDLPEDTTRRVLKKLWNVYDRNWDFIEAENYRALADGIFEYQENQGKEEAKKRKDAHMSNESEPHLKRLNSAQSQSRAVLGNPESDPSRFASRSKPNEIKLPQSHTRAYGDEPKAVLFGAHSKDEGRETVPSSQSFSKQDTAGASHYSPLTNSTKSRSISQHASQSARWKEPSERDKGKKPVSHQNALRENESVSERVSIGVSFKEPKVEHGKVMVHNDCSNDALVEHMSEPLTRDDCQLEIPMVVRPLNQYPGVNEGWADGGDGFSPTGHNTGLSLEVANIAENSFSNFEIDSSPLGEVKISLSCTCSAGRQDCRMPSLDAVLKLARDRSFKSHKVIDPGVSLIEVMEKLCQYFLQLIANPTNDKNIWWDGDFFKKNSPAAIGFEGIHEGHIHMTGSSSNGMQNCPRDHHILQSRKKVRECDGGRHNKRSDQNCSESSNSHSMHVHNEQFIIDRERPPHNLDDIAKGEERVKIPVDSQINSEQYPPHFHYISQNTTYQNAYINFSLARIGEDDCCSKCFGDCLTSPVPCACTKETGGVFAYTADGILKSEFLDKCMSTKRNSKTQYCNDCPLERSKNGFGKCKGHFPREFIKECWIKCGCDKQCGNRVVQRGITRNLQLSFTSEEKGWGVRTVEDLPRGAFVCEYVGEILTNIELYNRNEESFRDEKHTYPVLLDADWYSEGIMKDEEALCLDATRFGNIARFINHRCFDANLVEIPVAIETPDHHYYHVAFFTSRSVAASEELTWDYGIDFLDVDHPIKAFRCQCGSKFCRDIPLANCADSKALVLR